MGDEMRWRGLGGEDKRSRFHRQEFRDQEEVLNGVVQDLYLEVAAEFVGVEAFIKRYANMRKKVDDRQYSKEQMRKSTAGVGGYSIL